MLIDPESGGELSSGRRRRSRLLVPLAVSLVVSFVLKTQSGPVIYGIHLYGRDNWSLFKNWQNNL